MAAGGLVVVQIALGIASFRLRLQVEPLTVSHQAIGALLLGTLVAFTVLGFRDRIPVSRVIPADHSDPTEDPLQAIDGQLA
jgi:cytochrome c oxidase assembly protein subunit 15